MINCATYFLKNSCGEYEQYPLDSSQNIFKDYLDHLEYNSVMVFHRSLDYLVYYTYLKRINNGSKPFCLGISIVINDLETNNISSLFRLFEKVFQQIIFDEKVLTITSSGEISATDTPYFSLHSYFNRLSGLIKEYVNEGSAWFHKKSPYNYASNDDCAVLEFNVNDITVTKHLLQFNKLYFYKDSNDNGAELNGLQIKIRNLYNQLSFQKDYIKQLEDKENNSSTNWKRVSIVLLFIVGFLILISLFLLFKLGNIDFLLR